MWCLRWVQAYQANYECTCYNYCTLKLWWIFLHLTFDKKLLASISYVITKFIQKPFFDKWIKISQYFNCQNFMLYRNMWYMSPNSFFEVCIIKAGSMLVTMLWKLITNAFTHELFVNIEYKSSLCTAHSSGTQVEF